MAQKSTRIAAGAAALFFLVASLATSVAVIYIMVTHKDDKPSATNTSKTAQTNQENSLVGTKLANYTPSSDPVTSLQSTDTKVGDGAEAKAGSTVSVLYTGALVKDGTIFDASPTTPVSLSLNQVIKGWQEGVPGMKVGGTRRLVIPAADAYGAQSPSAAIPANSDLVFDITLVSVQ
jgi:FKBP-type peptidyl-prolyl cis-trans isomerase